MGTALRHVTQSKGPPCEAEILSMEAHPYCGLFGSTSVKGEKSGESLHKQDECTKISTLLLSEASSPYRGGTRMKTTEHHA
eukprot:2445071-Amphidinium_carterae.1